MSAQATESKADRFRRVAGFRVNRAVHDIDSLVNTADRSRYDFTDEQVQLVLGSLREAVDKLEVAYTTTNGAQRAPIEL